ncbi:hypothetical protein Zmor_005839 [Zophobas morio]|uniref:Uncharacterized protein n=1 Tax=Zophobas morio TaxID=2755281 RepID=A0AA38IVA3_9CUCU|nr:hypothetical protein Zmor_005839 [Zophobas morio]
MPLPGVVNRRDLCQSAVSRPPLAPHHYTNYPLIASMCTIMRSVSAQHPRGPSRATGTTMRESSVRPYRPHLQQSAPSKAEDHSSKGQFPGTITAFELFMSAISPFSR